MDVKTNDRARKPAEADKNMTATTNFIKDSYSVALRAAQDYNNKLLQFAQSNSDTAFEFAHRLLEAESPSELMELSNAARRQAATLADQTKELAALVEKLTLTSTDVLKSDASKTFRHAA